MLGTRPIAEEDDLIPISALQHMLYCPRQCALIHLERHWAENRYTAEGRILHSRVDSGATESRPSARVERSVPVRSLRVGIAGVVDVVEIHTDGSLYPIEYKRGRPKSHRADEVQLCAQALCLEEMLDTSVPEGALFYGRSRRRKPVEFNRELRRITERVAADTREMIATGRTPPPEYEPRKCDNCSLNEFCQPRAVRAQDAVRDWLLTAIER
ncbi:MAG: CRISPR-associated protein Cas4 [Gammaproteobacteria bacterium]|nr:CRISPR-associated protein Cas4 [Gammaproteobacteria bacterium]